jgi:hypothetical protein
MWCGLSKVGVHAWLHPTYANFAHINWCPYFLIRNWLQREDHTLQYQKIMQGVSRPYSVVWLTRLSLTHQKECTDYTCLISTLLTYSTDPSSNAGARLTFRVLRNQQSHWPPSCSSCSSLSCRPPTMLLFRGIAMVASLDIRLDIGIQPPGSPSSPTFRNSNRTPRLESLSQPGSWNVGLGDIVVSTYTSTKVLLQHLITHSKVTASFSLPNISSTSHEPKIVRSPL